MATIPKNQKGGRRVGSVLAVVVGLFLFLIGLGVVVYFYKDLFPPLFYCALVTLSFGLGLVLFGFTGIFSLSSRAQFQSGAGGGALFLIILAGAYTYYFRTGNITAQDFPVAVSVTNDEDEVIADAVVRSPMAKNPVVHTDGNGRARLTFDGSYSESLKAPESSSDKLEFKVVREGYEVYGGKISSIYPEEHPLPVRLKKNSSSGQVATPPHASPIPLTADSGWRDGGSSPDQFCGQMLDAYKKQYPDKNVVKVNQREDRNVQKGPFGIVVGVHYRYQCWFVANSS